MILTSMNCSDHLSWLSPHLLVPVPPVSPLPCFMSGLLWDLCSLVLEGKCLLSPFDVETDLGSTSIDDSSRDVHEWPPLDYGCPLIITGLYHHEVYWGYMVPTWTQRFFNIPLGKLNAWSANCKHMVVSNKGYVKNFSKSTLGIMFVTP